MMNVRTRFIVVINVGTNGGGENKVRDEQMLCQVFSQLVRSCDYFSTRKATYQRLRSVVSNKKCNHKHLLEYSARRGIIVI